MTGYWFNKGVLVGYEPKALKKEVLQKRKIPRRVLGHDLNELATKSGYHQCINTEYVLAFLTNYGIWSGKYPTPISNDEAAMTKQLSDGEYYMMGAYNPKEVGAFLEFSGHVYHWARNKLKERS